MPPTQPTGKRRNCHTYGWGAASNRLEAALPGLCSSKGQCWEKVHKCNHCWDSKRTCFPLCPPFAGSFKDRELKGTRNVQRKPGQTGPLQERACFVCILPSPQEQWADQVLVRGAELWQQPVSYQFAHGYTQVRKNIFLPKKRFFQNELAILPGFKR